MGVFSGIGTKEVWNQGGVYLETDSEFLLEVRRLQVIKTRSKGMAFIAEFNILESNNPQNPEGSSASWYQSLQDPDIGLSSVKGFMISLLNVNMDDPKERKEFESGVEEMLEEATSYKGPPEENPLYGQKIGCTTRTKTTKAEKKPFTQHIWRAV